MSPEDFERMFDARKAELEAQFAKGKVKFYANPIFAAQAGAVVGVAGTLLLQWLF